MLLSRERIRQRSSFDTIEVQTTGGSKRQSIVSKALQHLSKQAEGGQLLCRRGGGSQRNQLKERNWWNEWLIFRQFRSYTDRTVLKVSSTELTTMIRPIEPILSESLPSWYRSSRSPNNTKLKRYNFGVSYKVSLNSLQHSNRLVSVSDSHQTK